MRKLLTWVAGLAGIAALLRRRQRSRAVEGAPATAPDPAVELRQRLAETRTSEATVAAAAAEPPTQAAPLEEPASLDERRARIHERAQEAIDSMRGPDGDADDTDQPGGAA